MDFEYTYTKEQEEFDKINNAYQKDVDYTLEHFSNDWSINKKLELGKDLEARKKKLEEREREISLLTSDCDDIEYLLRNYFSPRKMKK